MIVYIIISIVFFAIGLLFNSKKDQVKDPGKKSLEDYRKYFKDYGIRKGCETHAGWVNQIHHGYGTRGKRFIILARVNVGDKDDTRKFVESVIKILGSGKTEYEAYKMAHRNLSTIKMWERGKNDNGEYIHNYTEAYHHCDFKISNL